MEKEKTKQELMYSEILSVIQKYRPYFQKQYNQKEIGGSDDVVLIDNKSEFPNFGVFLWIETDREKGIRKFDNVIIDKPEAVLRLYSERIYQIAKEIMDYSKDKEDALKIITKSLAPLLNDDEVFCLNPDCLVHGKLKPVKEEYIA